MQVTGALFCGCRSRNSRRRGRSNKRMTSKYHRVSLLAAIGMASVVYALTPPSASDGPVRLLACVVSPNGLLEASVDSQTDDRMRCHIRCTYQMADRTFNHSFVETIPPRFQGRVGQFDTTNGKAGSYPGDIGDCEKVDRPG